MTNYIRFAPVFLTLALCCRAGVPDAPTLHLIGDSTMAPKAAEKRPETGWGEGLGAHFVEDVKVNNTAVNGRSSKSFIDEGRWQKVLDALEPEDYVFIQFGHNDQKYKSPDRFAYPTTTYRQNLVRYIEETRARQAHPILLTSIVRRHFNDRGVLEDTHGLYPAVVRLAAEEYNVPMIDLQLLTESLVRTMGDEASRDLWLWLDPGENESYPKGVKDNTHLNEYGAAVIAGLAAEEIRRQNLPLAAWLKPAPVSQSASDMVLWPDGAPGSEGVAIEEKVDERSGDGLYRNRSLSGITEPSCRVFLPERPNGTAVLVCPGGGYGSLSFDKEGVEVARWLNDQGHAAFVLKYRLPGEGHADRSHVPLQDAQRAMRLIRANADAWGIDPSKAGVLGFSAGGHLASTLGTMHDRKVYAERDPSDRLSARPDFMVLLYPVISMIDGVGHGGSKANLLGNAPGEDAVRTWSTELQATKETPPTFLALADDDRSVIPENSLRFYRALKEKGVPAEMHIFTRGGHGFGLREEAGPAAGWPRLCEQWLAGQSE